MNRVIISVTSGFCSLSLLKLSSSFFARAISGKLGNAQIIDITEIKPTGKVIFGVTVDLMEEETGKEVTYQIVGEDEADIKVGKISITSPIARALIGKQEGDVAEVQAPGGVKEYEILSVKHI